MFQVFLLLLSAIIVAFGFVLGTQRRIYLIIGILLGPAILFAGLYGLPNQDLLIELGFVREQEFEQQIANLNTKIDTVSDVQATVRENVASLNQKFAEINSDIEQLSTTTTRLTQTVQTIEDLSNQLAQTENITEEFKKLREQMDTVSEVTQEQAAIQAEIRDRLNTLESDFQYFQNGFIRSIIMNNAETGEMICSPELSQFFTPIRVSDGETFELLPLDSPFTESLLKDMDVDGDGIVCVNQFFAGFFQRR